MALQNVLVVDDEPLIRKFLVETMTRMGFEVQSAADGAEALKKVKVETFDLIFTDIKMPQLNGMDLLRAVREHTPESVVVMMTAYATVESAVEAMKVGAFDYIIKPFSPDQIEMVTKRAAERQSLIEENKYLRSEILKEYGFGEIIGKTPVMHGIFEVIRKVANSRATVLVQGESGTGKELVARAIHYNSARANAPFIKVNCAALPENLLESEIFGHEKGAFTGAVTRRPGRFELAHRGTLLLDEISEIPLGLQAKLLRVLQEREFERVGGTRPIKVDVRIVATTNRNLDEEIEAKRFREDLFFRLNVVPLRLPPLRERTEDIPDLIRHFFAQAEREGLPAKQIDQAALDRLKRHRWPGNVRELENLARRLAALYPQETISAAVVEVELAQPMLPVGSDEQRSDESLTAAVERHLSAYFAGFEDGLPPAGLYHRILREIEYPLLTAALAATRGNQIRAADLLGVNRNTLRKKIRDLDIQVYRGGS